VLMNRGYADRMGNPVPDKEREKQSTHTNTMTTQTWTQEEMQAYLADKYGVKAVLPNGDTKVPERTNRLGNTHP
jgi:hypothetical protein